MTAGCLRHPSSVTRVVDGRERTGRYLAPEAYAAYMKGAYHEAHGELKEARKAYSEAYAADSEGPEIPTRLAAVACHLRVEGAPEALAKIANDNPRYAPAWREAARCHLSRRQPRRALVEARRAATLSPEVRESTELVTRSYEAVGQPAEARRWQSAWLLAHPDGSVASETASPGDELRRALDRGDLDAAQNLAQAADVTSGELAALAVNRGRLHAAIEQADLVLGAEPDNADAWIARVAAADLRGDLAALRRVLEAPPTYAAPLNPASARLLGEVIGRLVGSDAAASWQSALSAPADNEPSHRSRGLESPQRGGGAAPPPEAEP